MKFFSTCKKRTTSSHHNNTQWALFMCGQDEIERQGSVLVDYADLTRDQTVRKALPDLTTELKEQPEMMLNCLGVAIHQVYANLLSGTTTCKNYAKIVNSLLNHYFILYTVCT